MVLSVARAYGPKTDARARREQIVRGHAWLVRRVVGRLLRRLPPHVEADDLHAAGVIGLLAAHDSFDPAIQADFVRYAEYRVRGAILDEIRRMDVLPRRLRNKVARMEASRQRLAASLGRAPEIDEIARETGLDTEDIRQIEEWGDASRLTGLAEAWEVADETCTEEAILERDLLARIQGALSLVAEEHRTALGLYYDEGLTLKEMGCVLSCSEATACRLVQGAIAALRLAIGPQQA